MYLDYALEVGGPVAMVPTVGAGVGGAGTLGSLGEGG